MILMDLKLAHLLLTAPDATGFVFIEDEQVLVVARLRVTQDAFDSIRESVPLIVAGGGTAYGPAFVGILEIGIENKRGERQELSILLDPSLPAQMNSIRRLAQAEQVALLAFDPALAQLGRKVFPLSKAARAVIGAAAAAAEGAANSRPDPQAVATLPSGMTPFGAAALSILDKIQKRRAR